MYIFGGMFIVYGIYLLLGLRFKFRHLYCAMQLTEHREMTPCNSGCFTQRMKKDIKFFGYLFIVMGIVIIVIPYLGI